MERFAFRSLWRRLVKGGGEGKRRIGKSTSQMSFLALPLRQSHGNILGKPTHLGDQDKEPAGRVHGAN